MNIEVYMESVYGEYIWFKHHAPLWRVYMESVYGSIHGSIYGEYIWFVHGYDFGIDVYRVYGFTAKVFLFIISA